MFKVLHNRPFMKADQPEDARRAFYSLLFSVLSSCVCNPTNYAVSNHFTSSDLLPSVLLPSSFRLEHLETFIKVFKSLLTRKRHEILFKQHRCAQIFGKVASCFWPSFLQYRNIYFLGTKFYEHCEFSWLIKCSDLNITCNILVKFFVTKTKLSQVRFAFRFAEQQCRN